MKKIIPIIVSTPEGMHNACRDGAVIIYAERILSEDVTEKIANMFGYCRAEKRGRRGVFYRKVCAGSVDEYEIWDPMGIL